MKDFALDENGDIIIKNGDIQMIYGDNQVRQKAEKLIGTNKGEWFLNRNEGINFRNVLTKNPSEDVVKYEILQALLRIDDTFHLESFSLNVNNRGAMINFTAMNKNGSAIKGANVWD